MFHTLGRFAFTSFLSRRSSRGCPMGSPRFGFCCCERGLLSVFTISIQIHPLFAIERCYAAACLRNLSTSLGAVPRGVQCHSYGSVLAPITCPHERGDFLSRPPHPALRSTSGRTPGLSQGLRK